MKSRSEVDFLRLLHQCQRLADQNSWRLEPYVETLTELLDKLRNQNVNQLSRDTLEEYGRKVQFLKGIIETEKLPSAEKRLLAAELLAPDRDTKTAYLITRNRYHEQMRQELLPSDPQGAELKRRKMGKGDIGKRKDDSDVNEEITKNLLELTNNIRENMRAAQDIIQRDNETLAKVALSADDASVKMQKNNDKLFEFVDKGCDWIIWLNLVIVTCMFLMVVVFIRFNPKQT